MEYIKNGKGLTTRCCECVIRNPIPPCISESGTPLNEKHDRTNPVNALSIHI